MDSADIAPPTREEAYAIQDATLAELGPVAGWKVGAKGVTAEPIGAPLPSSCVFASGARLEGGGWALRGLEVEVALRVGRDFAIGNEPLTPADLASAFDAVYPAIEVVETRLDGWKDSPPLAQLADLQSHGALVLGPAAPFDVAALDLRRVEAQIFIGPTLAKRTLGGNPGVDVWRLLAWLAKHCAARGQPLRKGQIVTTGSCTGMVFARPGDAVLADIASLGRVELFF
ncbi:MAG: Hydratase/decarboxylase [Rhodoferax sp.]|nr:Hydratase/decarboxylase [Rhodoferax sp.]